MFLNLHVGLCSEFTSYVLVRFSILWVFVITQSSCVACFCWLGLVWIVRQQAGETKWPILCQMGRKNHNSINQPSYSFVSYSTGHFRDLFPASHLASRYANQHIWCMSQARVNWEGCGRKSIWRKIGGRGMMEVGASMVQIGWRPAGLLVHLPLLSSPCLIKSRMMTDSHNTFQVWVGECLLWYRPTQVVPDKVKRQCVCVCDHLAWYWWN